MSIMVGVGQGAENGILIRHAEALEALQHADTLIVDKTGTLTEGKPGLKTIEPASGVMCDEVLSLAASLERSNEHSLAAEIVWVQTQPMIRLRPVFISGRNRKSARCRFD